MPLMFALPGVDLVAPPYEILASKEVRHVGDAIAFVVADTVEQARDAAEAIAVDWETMPAVIDAVSALKPGAPLVWPDKPGNLVFDKDIGNKEKTDQGVCFCGKDRLADDRQSAACHQLSRHPRRGR